MERDNFLELLKALSLSNIQFLESHEKVLQAIQNIDNEKIEIRTTQGLPKEDPGIENGSTVFFRPKYAFAFLVEGKEYFRAEYRLLVVFISKNTVRVQELLSQEDTRELFLTKQLHKTLWPVLRATVLDAFNRHSLQPIALPWIL